MKPKAHLRIVCLKNNYSSKSYHNQQNYSTSTNNKPYFQSQNTVVPNLVYLSARLQEVQKNNQNSRIGSTNKKIEEIQQLVGPDLRDRREISLRETDDKQLTIHQYFQRKRQNSEKQKMTIRSMMGSIDFSTDKKRQRKISKNIKQTLLKDEINHRLHKRKKSNQEQMNKYSVNRVFLQEDFKKFLNNKQSEYRNPKIVDLKQEQNRKLHKLTIVNPERQRLKELKESSKSINLFNFLSTNKDIKPKSPSKQSSCLRLDPANSNLRLQKKMMKPQDIIGRFRLEEVIS